MELEEEAQICRLCGQCESIYIDVFGEEGTKRFLGLKIHTKINILIEQNDGLPQIVCVRCLGTLEFLCDFYDRCHQSQKEFLQKVRAKRANGNAAELNQDEDAESDKENTRPPSEGNSRAKDLPIMITNDSVRAQKNKNDNMKNCSDVLDKRETNNIDCPVKVENSEKENNNDKRPALRTTRSMNECDPDQKNLKNEEFDSAKWENVLPRKKRGRKNKVEKMLELNESLNVMLKRSASTISRTRSRGDEGNQKRLCLRPLNGNVESQPRKYNGAKEVNQRIQKLSESESANSNDTKAPKQTKDPEPDAAVKGRPVSVIVKQEKIDMDDVPSRELPARLIKSNQVVWIPSEMILPEPEKPKLRTGLKNTSPPPGDEANAVPVIPTNADSSISEEDSLTTTQQSRGTVIKCSQNNTLTDEDVPAQEEDCKEVENITMNMDSSDASLDDSTSGRKSKDRTFGKISELISDEQKQIIETYYEVDMSVVNAEEVQKCVTTVDKKNIRCNICNVTYLRMDKCQVHVWGHLKMRPYKCKACDFATVTVSNVRCHIRKSHLKIKPFACDQCEKRYVTAVLLEEHMNTHTGARPFKCKLCDFASANRQMLSYHMATHKPVKDINCKLCGKEFYSKGRLRAHMLVHNKDKVVMCKLCSAYLSNAEALEMHHKNVHTRDYVCNVCGKRVKSRKALHNHQNVHAAAKYKCSLCPNVYKSSQILKEHLLKHEGIRKYKCNVCEKSFAQQSHLAAHMAVHSKIRFHCPGCDKAFNRHDNMKIHTKRCKQFIANPELKNLISRRERYREKLDSETKPLISSSNSKVSLAFVPYMRIEEDSTSTKSAGTTIKTDSIASNSEVITPDEGEAVINDVVNFSDPTTIEVVKSIENTDNVPIELDSETIVSENILGPESY